MHRNQILELIKLLDNQIPKESADVRLADFGEVALYANKDGYIRMGIELLKCAFDETKNEVELEYLFSKESDFSINHVTTSLEEYDFFRK
jgi:hypothetical protein